MTVCDDRRGLSPDVWESATGGLDNARVWSEMCGGEAQLTAPRSSVLLG